MNSYQEGAVRTGRDEPQPTTLTQNFLERLRKINESLTDIAGNAQRNADRLIGGSASAASGKNGPTPVPNGTLAELDEVIAGLSNRVAAVGQEVDRFNSL